ncbi:DUF1775 domain-containing protein [Caulobacter segnis]
MTKAPLIALLALVASPLLATGAAAHVVAVPDTAKAGSYSAASPSASVHACAAGDATLRIRIEIPAGVVSARPQMKPGWTYTLERGPDPKAAPTRDHLRGPPARRGLRRLRGADGLPAVGGPGGDRLVFPVIQTCERARASGPRSPVPTRRTRS